jgi:hypothetical protein
LFYPNSKLSLAHGSSELSDDILQGAEAIAAFMFGDAPGAVRTVYRIATEVPASLRLPTFKLGSNRLCARKSVILRWIEQQESDRTTPREAETLSA